MSNRNGKAPPAIPGARTAKQVHDSVMKKKRLPRPSGEGRTFADFERAEQRRGRR